MLEWKKTKKTSTKIKAREIIESLRVFSIRVAEKDQESLPPLYSL